MDIGLFVVFLALALSATMLVLFVVLVISIKREDKRHLPNTAASPMGAMSRRVLGTYAHHHVTRAGVNI
ncbi:hypothetical protein [Nonomuraea sp. NPDC005501]|uniref:hypothetical protein n=1 Tax=Nonomuraea sp. NPDC005501 TaxID=3156884 RepID=UPI00339E1BD2